MSHSILNYQHLQPIYKSANSIVYRGIRKEDNQPVILKLLQEDYPTASELTRYKQEYQITHHLKIEGVIQAYSLEPYQRTFMIILEDFGASSLAEFIQHQSTPEKKFIFDLEQFLRIAIKITAILGRIHVAGVIHKDINPSNIVFNPNQEELKIIDFGISTTFTRENPTLKNPNLLEGTLAYLSPEQTGRMNCALDYRTDFYSLGVTFYELLTGQLPFETQDALELVHCHLAKQPIPPHEIQPTIPIVISQIIMRLMEKTPEKRYQSAFGIRADLEQCLNQLKENKNLKNFPIATQDITDKFKVSQKLYGREREVNQLLAAFFRVASSQDEFGRTRRKNKIEMMLVTGYSGVGKSSLVQEIYKPITEKRGYFISGKFDQLQRNIPYYAVVSAFKELVKQLLSENADILNQWREKLLTVLGTNGQVIIDVIPEVELMIGHQPPVPQLGLQESQNRFNFVFQNFIRAFCTKEHPLVIFLDDLQWADVASLNLIGRILTDSNLQYLFLIGAYRDNEIHPSHPLMMILDQVRKDEITINSIHLEPLTLEAVSQLISDTLYCDLLSVTPLAKLVVEKTEGNPFFVNEFLKTLYSENLLTFTFPQSSLKSQRGFWQWDIDQIKNQQITDNVVNLMIDKIKKLPKSTQNILRFAACIGAFFDLKTLSIICNKLPSEVYQKLIPALQSGLILPTSELDCQLLIQNYKFLHDRVQQAAYSLINDIQKQEIHWKMGCLLWQNTAPGMLLEEVFKIVDHLNLGMIESQDFSSFEFNKNAIANLNLIAGQKAKSSTAYQAASEYFNQGLKLLNQQSWQQEYELTLALHEGAVEVAYLKGDFPEMNHLAEIVLSQAQTVLDRVKVYDAKIQAAVSRGDLKIALKIGLEVLELLGINLPKQPSQLDIQRSLEETALCLVKHNIEDLIDLPLMEEPKALAALHILSSITAAAYISDPQLFLLVATSQVNLSIQYGNTTESALGYACYGAILCGVVEEIEAGYQFGILAFNLVKSLNAKKIKAKVYDVLAGHILSWKDHCQKIRPIALEGYSSGLENGELEFASYCGFWICVSPYFVGHELKGLEQEIAVYSQGIGQIRQEAALNWIAIFWQSIQNLLGNSEDPTQLMGNIYNEEQGLTRALAISDRVQINFFYLNKLILLYLFEQYNQAQQNSICAEQYLDGVMGMIVVPIFYFYDSLVHLSLWMDASNREKESWLNRVNWNQSRIQKWAYHSPTNFLNKFYLVEAEKAKVLGQFLEAEEYYEQAISHADIQGFIQEEALAYELAAKFYLGRGRFKIAQTYMKEAHYLYIRWGAKAKVEDLEAKYSKLIHKSTALKNADYTANLTFQTTTGSQSSGVLDLATVIKASQAISGEIVLDKLLEILIKILIENAGAQFGYLILKTDNNLLIEAEGSADSNSFNVLQSIPALESNLVATSIIHYVVNTGEPIVLNNASREGKFINDPYIKAKQSQSILCLPLMNQGKLTSLVYLENDRATGAFTHDRLELLQLLSAQAAIAIENAGLYANVVESHRTLETKVKERTAELAIAKQKAEAAAETKSIFLANMSHELRSPLNTILGFAQLLQKSLTLAPEDQEKIRIIYRSGEHLLTLINDVLDMAKIESGCMTLNETNFNLVNLLNDLKDMFSLKAQEKRLQFIVEYSADVPQRIWGDEVKLRQVLINLLSNAFKFTSSGCVTLRTQLQTMEDQSTLAFEVEDMGCGISAHELKRIFEPFVQTKSGQQVQGGTGLGLSISHYFVQLMGGKMAVESEVGVGTLFKFNIPAQVVEVMEQNYCENTSRVMALEPHAQNHKLLIIDDHPDTRLLLIELLQPLNLEIREVNNNIEAIQKWESWRPDLILIDVQIPSLNGDKITQEIRRRELEKANLEGFKPVKIIAISASPFDQDGQIPLDIGYDDFINKPFTEADIFEAISRQIGIEVRYSNGEFGLEETANPSNPNSEISSASTLTRLVALPSELLEKLEQAVIRLNSDVIQRVLGEISTCDEVLVQSLQTFINDFNHSTLWDLIQAAKLQK